MNLEPKPKMLKKNESEGFLPKYNSKKILSMEP